MTQHDTADSQHNTEAQFMIQRLFIKDLSFESPNSPAVFQQQWEPELSLDLNTEHTELEKNVYEVVLTVTVTVKNNETIAFLVEMKQAGIFSIKATSKDQVDYIINSYCPNILFPYAREAITSQVVRGSFPQLVLAPINFDALYEQQKQEKLRGKNEPVDAAH